MEETRLIKCESGWLTAAAGETSSYVPDLTFPLATDLLPAVKIEPHHVFASENVQVADTRIVMQEDENEFPLNIKNEKFIAELADDQMFLGLKQEKNVETAAVLTVMPVELCRVRQSTDTGDEEYCCLMCSTTLTEGSLEAHLLAAHSVIMPFECSICGSTFVYLSNLRKHGITHSVRKTLSCSSCGRTFKYPTHLRTHEKLNCHRRPFSCSTCGKAFRKAFQVRSHEKMHRPSSCSICGKTFVSSNSLTTHKKVHIDSKPYSCFCGQDFEKPFHLRKHEEMHLNSGPFSCSTCGQAFARLTQLRKHEVMHSHGSSY